MFRQISQIFMPLNETYRRLELSRVFLSTLMMAALLVTLPGVSFAESALLKTADRQISNKKYKAAARTITKAMNSGELSDSEMAQALYRRGVAYNGSARHSSAIADLTGAIWLGKLGSAARKDAYRQRASAYQATGHKKLARSDLGKAGAGAASVQPVAKKPATAAANPPISGFDTVVRAAKKPALPTRSKIATKKPIAPKKPVIPAFRTSIATE